MANPKKAIKTNLTQEEIAKNVHADLVGTKFYKAKIVFLGVNKNDKNYKPFRSIGVNGRQFRIDDSMISYIPVSLLNAISDAVPVYTEYANDRQKEHGIHYGTGERFMKVPNPKYDITIFQELTLDEDANGKRFFRVDSDKSGIDSDDLRKNIEERVKRDVMSQVKKDSEKIITDASVQADSIIKDAMVRAEKIISDAAGKSVEEIREIIENPIEASEVIAEAAEAADEAEERIHSDDEFPSPPGEDDDIDNLLDDIV